MLNNAHIITQSRSAMTSLRETILYPTLGAESDFYWLRFGGCGLGNAFYTYFHTVRIAAETGARVMAPAWRSVKPRRLLQGKSERSYWSLFQPHSDEISGAQKLHAALFTPRGPSLDTNQQEFTLRPGQLHHVGASHFTFDRLHDQRESIRRRLEAISTFPRPNSHKWGQGGYIALHVRLGDFAEPRSSSELASGRTNLRIPIQWYLNVLLALRDRYPDLPVLVLSDGTAHELAELLSSGAQLVRTGSDIGDLYMLAGASFLLGSNSTFSRWAAFLGDMPSAWLATTAPQEKPSSREIAIHYLPPDAQHVAI
jgi:hypothetical protein